MLILRLIKLARCGTVGCLGRWLFSSWFRLGGRCGLGDGGDGRYGSYRRHCVLPSNRLGGGVDGVASTSSLNNCSRSVIRWLVRFCDAGECANVLGVCGRWPLTTLECSPLCRSASPRVILRSRRDLA